MDYTVSEHSASTPKNSSGWPLEKVKSETEPKANPLTNGDDWSDDEWWT